MLRFQRVGVFPQAGEPAATGSSEDALQGAAAFPAPLRSGLLVEVEQYWQSLGCHSGDLLYSMSLPPGDEARAVVLDGRWRREPDAPQRPLQILARMVGTSTLGDGGDAVPLEAFVVTDLQAALIDTVKLLSQRTVRMSEALRRRPLGVTELAGDIPPTAAIRTIRNTRVEGVVTYHFFEPLERFRVIVRTPRVHPVLLVPFRLPNIATFEVVREFSHVIRRALLDRALLPDLERLLAADRAAPGEARIFAHIAANLSYYSAAIITAGDPAGRRAALAKLRDSAGRVLTEVIENTVVGRAGNYVAFPLRSAEFASPEYRAIVGAYEARAQRFSDEIVVTVPIPGVWLRSELAAPMQEPARASAAAEGEEEGRDRSGRVGRRPGRRG